MGRNVLPKLRRSGLPVNPLLTPLSSLSGESGDSGLLVGELEDNAECGMRKSGERFLAESSAEFLTEAVSRFTDAS